MQGIEVTNIYPCLRTEEIIFLDKVKALVLPPVLALSNTFFLTCYVVCAHLGKLGAMQSCYSPSQTGGWPAKQQLHPVVREGTFLCQYIEDLCCFSDRTGAKYIHLECVRVDLCDKLRFF